MEREDRFSVIARVRHFFDLPVDQSERFRAGCAGFGFLVSSGLFALLRGLSTAPIIAVLAAVFFGLVSFGLGSKQPDKKLRAVGPGVLAGLLLVTIIPGLRGMSNFIFGCGIWFSLAIAGWKLGSVVYSVFTRKH